MKNLAVYQIFHTFATTYGCRDGGMVDTRDLKSLGHNGCAGSSPARGTVETLRGPAQRGWPSCYICLYTSFFVIAVIGAVGNDDVVKQFDAHHVAGPLEAIRQLIVKLTGT